MQERETNLVFQRHETAAKRAKIARDKAKAQRKLIGVLAQR